MAIGNIARRITPKISTGPTLAGATSLNGATLALAAGNAYSVLWVVDLGTVGTIDGANPPSFRVEESADGGSNWTTVKHSVDDSDAVLPIDVNFSTKLAVIELIQPRKPHVRLVINRGGGTNSIVVDSALAFVLGPRVEPVPTNEGDGYNITQFVAK